MIKTITYKQPDQLFIIRLKSSFYAMRVLESGELVHVGWHSIPAAALSCSATLGNLEDYFDMEPSMDVQSLHYEFSAKGDISYHDSAIQAVFSEPPCPLKPGENFHETVRDLRLRYVSHDIVEDAVPGFAPKHGTPASLPSARETLVIHLKDTLYDFDVTLFYRVTPGQDVIERWVEVRNRTSNPVKLERLDFAGLHLPSGTTSLTYVSGQWGREFIPTTTELSHGTFVVEQRGINTGHSHNPFFLLNAPGKVTEESGEVWFGALAFSGNWNLRFEALPSTAVRVFGGYGLNDFELVLQPGQSHTTPAMVLGCSPEGFGGASRRLHRFARERVLPGYPKDEVRPVLYNSWEATAFDVSEENQTALANIAASIGIELFCIDDGWFGARRSDRAGLGDWVVRADAFPAGLKPLADKVKALGMKFGLWVEPEMVNPDSDLYRAHPDWVLHYPGRPRTESRNQLILDFGRPEVIEYLFAVLDGLVRENGIDFFKWDMNRYVTESGSVAGRDIWRAHVTGLYQIMDRLRANHPGLDIQSCSGGGARVDLGILARCDQAWTSDNTDAHDRTRIEEGFSLAYPPRAMECWVTEEINWQTRRVTSLDLRFDVAMRGALGLGPNLNKLSTKELEAYKKKITFYKRIRPLVQDGDLYRLATIARGNISTWLFVAPDQSAAAYSTVVLDHLQKIVPAPTVLRGLDAGANYRILDEDGKSLATYSGFQLMTMGLPSSLVFGSMMLKPSDFSRTLLFVRE